MTSTVKRYHEHRRRLQERLCVGLIGLGSVVGGLRRIASVMANAERHDVPVVGVDPKCTSQTCPVCGFYPMTYHVGRNIPCPRCGVFSRSRCDSLYEPLETPRG